MTPCPISEAGEIKVTTSSASMVIQAFGRKR